MFPLALLLAPLFLCMQGIINKGLQRVQQVIMGFLLYQFYYNQVTVTDTRNLLEYYLKPFKPSIQSK